MARAKDDIGNHIISAKSMKEIVRVNLSPVYHLSKSFPQLVLPIELNEMNTPEYKKAVLRGEPVCREPNFICSPDDKLETVETPVGKVEILYLVHREDFEHALRALAYRCEPVEIPASVGASTIRGLINWEKINAHKTEYLAKGGKNWREEFKRFTAEKSNYLDTLILLSNGNYSAIPARFVGLAESEWDEKSLIIRKYHELTHFVCRTLYPHNIEPIRDEVIADLIGLVATFDQYDPLLAKRFLGIESGAFHEGGRLSHYTDGGNLEAAAKEAGELIDQLAEQVSRIGKKPVFDLLKLIIREYMNED